MSRPLPPSLDTLAWIPSDPDAGDLARMVSAQRRLVKSLAADETEHGCEARAAHEATLRFLEAELDKRQVDVSGKGPLDRLEEMADVLRFEVPPSHRSSMMGKAVTFAKRAAVKGLRPFHVELLRNQRDFDIELVDALRKLLRGPVAENTLRGLVQGLRNVADPAEQRVQSHRTGGVGALVGAAKRGYLRALTPVMRAILEAQRRWNEGAVELLAKQAEWGSTAKPEARALLEKLTHDIDPVAAAQGRLGKLGVPLWREVFRRQAEFNREVLGILAGVFRVHPPAAPRAADEYTAWYRAEEPEQIRHAVREAASLTELGQGPLLSIVTPIYETPEPLLRACIDSVLGQAYPRFELCLADDGSKAPHVERVLAEYARKDTRVKRVRLEANGGIAKATNAALALATGDYVCFLDHDDTLAPHALAEVALKLVDTPDTDVLYSDEDQLDPEGRRVNPFFKPGWSPDLIRSVNYVCHFLVVRRALVERVGRVREGFDGAQDYDLVLRLSEATDRFARIPRILYHWRQTPQSTAASVSNKPGATVAGKRALTEHLARLGVKGATVEDPVPTNYRVRYPLPAKKPLVSIMVPFKDKPELLKTLTRSLLGITTYERFELLLVSNNSEQPETFAVLDGLTDKRIRKLEWNEPFNYSGVNNFAAKHAKGDVFVFLNNDIEIVDPAWLDELVSQALRKEIGAVGPKLLFPDGTLQHVGVVVGLQGFAGHAFVGMNEGAYTAFGSSEWPRNYLAVTSACVAMRREVFEEIGGYDERFIVCGSDVELCLRMTQMGLRVMYTPYTRMIHDESSTRRVDRIPEIDFWRSFEAYRPYLGAEGDPFYNPNLSLGNADGSLRRDARTGQDLAVQTLATALPGSRVVPATRQRLESVRHVTAHLDTFDYTPERIAEVRAGAAAGLASLRKQGRIERIQWFVPYFRHPYGGVHTILRFGDLLRERHGVQSQFVVYDNPNASVKELEARVAPLFPKLVGKLSVLRTPDELESLEPTDLAIATLWTSAYVVLRHPRVKVRGYFVQDYEPAFYPAGTFYGLTEQTYRMGFYGLFNTQGLHDYVTAHYPMEGTWFEPTVDRPVFHARRPERAPKPVRIFFYGRPSTDRNAFELGIASLAALKRELGDAVQILSAGEPWNPADYGAAGLIENLGVLPYEKTGELYRSCDVGLCFMFTKHPSYLPFEMMACGVTVVTNDNPANHWLLVDGENCLLAEPTLSGVLAPLRRAVADAGLRARIGAAAAKRVIRTTWEEQADKVYEGIVGRGRVQVMGGTRTG